MEICLVYNQARNFCVFSNLLITLFYLNNEKLPFMLELSSINQMYFKY